MSEHDLRERADLFVKNLPDTTLRAARDLTAIHNTAESYRIDRLYGRDTASLAFCAVNSFRRSTGLKYEFMRAPLNEALTAELKRREDLDKKINDHSFQ